MYYWLRFAEWSGLVLPIMRSKTDALASGFVFAESTRFAIFHRLGSFCKTLQSLSKYRTAPARSGNEMARNNAQLKSNQLIQNDFHKIGFVFSIGQDLSPPKFGRSRNVLAIGFVFADPPFIGNARYTRENHLTS